MERKTLIFVVHCIDFTLGDVWVVVICLHKEGKKKVPIAIFFNLGFY